MFGIGYIKAPPTSYLIKYSGGKIQKEGAGTACFYYAPMATLVLIPVGSNDIPFIFEEVSKDFQEITVQGQVTYQIQEPKKIASLLDYSLNKTADRYESDDPEKLSQRIINIINVLIKKEIKELSLEQVIKASETITSKVQETVVNDIELAALGVKILGFSILAIKPNSETALALEAETKEALLKKADEAIYARRNAAIEQERAIRENELNTEIAVEEKQRQIREKEMETEKLIQEKEYQLKQEELTAKITLEETNKTLVALSSENVKAEADAKAYAMKALLDTVANMNPKVLQAITSQNMSPDQLISQAFQELAEHAEKIGQLNISPELLNELLKTKKR